MTANDNDGKHETDPRVRRLRALANSRIDNCRARELISGRLMIAASPIYHPMMAVRLESVLSGDDARLLASQLLQYAESKV